LKGIISKPAFNLWTVPSVPLDDLVLSDQQTKKKKYAFPMQLHPNIYTALFTLFYDKGSIKHAIHINANICQSLAIYDEGFWKLHVWETSSDYYKPGLLAAAASTAAWNYDIRKQNVSH
jgi:hypothetical protein